MTKKKRKRIKPLDSLSLVQLYKYLVSRNQYDNSRLYAIEFLSPSLSTYLTFEEKITVIYHTHHDRRIPSFFSKQTNEFDEFIYLRQERGIILTKKLLWFCRDYMLYVLYPPALDACKTYRNLYKKAPVQLRLAPQFSHTCVDSIDSQWMRKLTMSKDKHMFRFLIKHLPQLNQDTIEHILSFLPGYFGRFVCGPNCK